MDDTIFDLTKTLKFPSQVAAERDQLREELNSLEQSFCEVETERRQLEQTAASGQQLQLLLEETKR